MITRDDIKPFHSFWHTFITKCRELNVREDVQNAVTGHKAGGVGRGCGSFSIPLLNDLIQKTPRMTVANLTHDSLRSISIAPDL